MSVCKTDPKLKVNQLEHVCNRMPYGWSSRQGKGSSYSEEGFYGHGDLHSVLTSPIIIYREITFSAFKVKCIL